jgi:ATP-binding cassette, subfamily G (WHITE), member 2, PDR
LASQAKDYFIRLGFECPDRQTTPDFLTSMTSPAERIIRPGFEQKVPRTADDFASTWKNSPEYQKLCEELDEYDRTYKIGGEHLERFVESRRAQQARLQ